MTWGHGPGGKVKGAKALSPQQRPQRGGVFPPPLQNLVTVQSKTHPASGTRASERGPGGRASTVWPPLSSAPLTQTHTPQSTGSPVSLGGRTPGGTPPKKPSHNRRQTMGGGGGGKGRAGGQRDVHTPTKRYHSSHTVGGAAGANSSGTPSPQECRSLADTSTRCPPLRPSLGPPHAHPPAGQPPTVFRGSRPQRILCAHARTRGRRGQATGLKKRDSLHRTLVSCCKKQGVGVRWHAYRQARTDRPPPPALSVGGGPSGALAERPPAERPQPRPPFRARLTKASKIMAGDSLSCRGLT